MKNKKKLVGLFAVAALSVSALALCTMQPASASAEETEVSSYFTIQPGASVRLPNNDDVSGIRFAAYVSKPYYDALKTTYSTAESITLESTVSKVVGEGETAPAPLPCSWNIGESISFDEDGVATFYHTLNFNVTGDDLKAANAFVLQADFWIEVTTAEGTETIPAENEVDTTRAMRQVAYTAYTTPGPEEDPNPTYQDERLFSYFTLGTAQKNVHEFSENATPMKELAPVGVNATAVYAISDNSVEDITNKQLADTSTTTDVGVFTYAETYAKEGTTKEFVYFDANNVAYPTTTWLIKQFIDDETELKAVLHWGGSKNTYELGYNLLTTDITATAEMSTTNQTTLQNGTFDGNGHTITVTTSNSNRMGVFGYALYNATVKNVEINLTRYFPTGYADRQGVFAYNTDAATVFENVSLNLSKKNLTDNSKDTYLYLLNDYKAIATNVAVHVQDGLYKPSSGTGNMTVRGFAASASLYTFSNQINIREYGGVNFYKNYASVAAAGAAGEKFTDLTGSGCWTFVEGVDDENNKTYTLTFVGKTEWKYDETDTTKLTFVGAIS